MLTLFAQLLMKNIFPLDDVALCDTAPHEKNEASTAHPSRAKAAVALQYYQGGTRLSAGNSKTK